MFHVSSPIILSLAGDGVSQLEKLLCLKSLGIASIDVWLQVKNLDEQPSNAALVI